MDKIWKNRLRESRLSYQIIMNMATQTHTIQKSNSISIEYQLYQACKLNLNLMEILNAYSAYRVSIYMLFRSRQTFPHFASCIERSARSSESRTTFFFSTLCMFNSNNNNTTENAIWIPPNSYFSSDHTQLN